MLTLTAYNAKQKGQAMPENLYHWSQTGVVKILERREYSGCTVNFKTYTKSLKFRKRMENPKENYRIFEETQPAIIEQGQWDRVQALRSNKCRRTKTGRTSIFSGLMRCADCGSKLYFCTSRKAELAQKRKALSGAQKRMEDLGRIIQRLYEDSVLGKLSDMRFQKLSAQYEMEQEEIRQLSAALEKEIADGI